MEVELAECRGGVSTALTTEERKVAGVHSGVLKWGKRQRLIQSLSRRRVGRVLIDEVRLETVLGFERLGAEEAVVSWLVFAEVSMIMGPAGFSGDKQAVFTTE
jgi:hypothetical protein